jgi:glycosyltransferase involved in cell wall biosynthesis
MDLSNSTVAVIIPTYNRAELVGQAIDSILAQTRRADEIVVIDDGSTDATAQVLAAYGDKIHYLHQTNAGKPVALNHAMDAISADYLWIMDDDDVALPNALEMYLAFLQAHPEVDFSYSGYYEFEGDRPPGPVAAKTFIDCLEFAPDEFFIRVMMKFPFLMQGMLVPVRCYRRVGPFDETLPRNQDYEMILRLARHFRGGRFAQPTFCLRIHPRLRGPAYEQFSLASQREAIYQKYNRQVFSSLRETLSLGDYLPRGTTGHTMLSDAQRRQALLQRACIMARHGLFDEAFEDLATVVDCYDRENKSLTRQEKWIFSQMLNVEAWWLRNYPDYSATIGKFLRKRRAFAALNACASGVAWRLMRDLRSKRYANAVTIGIHLQHLMGLRLAGVLRAGIHRQRRPVH